MPQPLAISYLYIKPLSAAPPAARSAPAIRTRCTLSTTAVNPSYLLRSHCLHMYYNHFLTPHAGKIGTHQVSHSISPLYFTLLCNLYHSWIFFLRFDFYTAYYLYIHHLPTTSITRLLSSPQALLQVVPPFFCLILAFTPPFSFLRVKAVTLFFSSTYEILATTRSI